MGQDKAQLRVPGSGQPLLQHMVARLHALPLAQVIVVTNQPDLAATLTLSRRARFVADDEPGIGPLGGIATGLRYCQGWGIFLACDLPLVNAQVIQFLCQLTRQLDHSGTPFDAIVPLIEGYPQPLHALYHVRILPIVQQTLQRGERRASSFLQATHTRWVSEAELRPFDHPLNSFVNANTPEAWRQACALLANEKPSST